MVQSQILESMAGKEEPDRSDLAEISKTTLDGADCFMLTHETSVWENPIEAITYVAKGIAEAESIFDYEQAFINVREETKSKGLKADNIDMLTTTGCGIALDNDVDLYVCLTETGKIARYLSK